jgi:hypothetical protein
VRELLGGFRRGDAREAGEQQGPASAAHQRGQRKQDRREARPDAQVSGRARAWSAGASNAGMHDTGGLGEARERPFLRRHVSGGALLDIPLEEVLAQILATRRAHRAPRGRGGEASGAAAGRREAGQRAADLRRDQDAGGRARRRLRPGPTRIFALSTRVGIGRTRTLATLKNLRQTAVPDRTSRAREGHRVGPKGRDGEHRRAPTARLEPQRCVRGIRGTPSARPPPAARLARAISNEAFREI